MTITTERIPNWHVAGNDVPADIITVKGALEYAGLDWDVEQAPVWAHHPVSESEILLPSYRANLRSDTMAPLAVVGKTYRPVPNREAFDFANELLGGGSMRFAQIGELGGGKVVWALLEIQTMEIFIGGDPDERIMPYLLLTTSHDGSLALGLAVTPMRLWCANQIRMAFGSSPAVWRTRHTSGIGDRIDIARKALGMSERYFTDLKEVGDLLISAPMASYQFERSLKELVPDPEDDGTLGAKQRATIADNRREAIRDVWAHSDNLGNIRHTRWGFLQAVAEWDDHYRTGSPDQKAKRALIGDTHSLKDRALTVAMASIQ